MAPGALVPTTDPRIWDGLNRKPRVRKDRWGEHRMQEILCQSTGQND